MGPRQTKAVTSDRDPRFSAPVVSLPKGGGAVRGIGEKFGANPVTGTGSLTVPIPTTPGRAGFGPQLSLAYDSGAGNGPFGLGWTLALPAITRKTEKGLPRYDDAAESDVFVISGAEDLVPALVEAGGAWRRDTVTRTVDGREYRIDRYRPRIEGLFARIERWTAVATGETHWRSISRDNVTTLYGKTAESRIADPADGARVFSWLICESFDDKGNAIVYRYKAETSEGIEAAAAHERNRTPATRAAGRYLKAIKYGNRVSRLTQPDLSSTDWMFEVVFDYGEHDATNPKPGDTGAWLCRHDPFSTWRAGYEVRAYRLCQRILVFHHFPDEPEIGRDCLVRSTDFTYRSQRGNPIDAKQGDPVASFIASVSQRGYARGANGGIVRSLPPVEFEYSEAAIDEEVHEIDASSLENLPQGVDGIAYRWVDLDGEGASGILTEQADGWFYKPNLGDGRFGALQRVATRPSFALAGGEQQLLDLAGDGQLDVVALSRTASGFFERTADGSWSPFKAFTGVPNVDWNDRNLRFVDLNGDGHADVLITESDVFTWFPSSAEAGFGPPQRVHTPIDDERGPRLIFGDGTESVYLADMSGDGLTDLVRIRNGEICYWPNAGYGRFGARVVMDDAPWFDSDDQFDHRRVRLADIDGSGNTDIIYLGRDETRIYFNQSGNRWSAARRLSECPPIDDLASVTTIDLFGNGTACLVWSSPLARDGRRPMRYIDLMGGRKPHLMVSTANNLGAETRVQYAPSTKFYFADQAAGRPWLTRLPFPVHVVERVDTYDRVSRNRFVTRYAYHHGHFDGAEREFRGFALVERWDTEEFAVLSASGDLPPGDNVDAASHVPPVLTKTWFHTGAFVDAQATTHLYEQEYYREPGISDAGFQRQLLPDVTLPVDLTTEDAREASRALKGSVLRVEVYGVDGSARASHPYSVSERSYGIRPIQPRNNARHPVFLVHDLETVNYHYERNPADPRVVHEATLEVDAFGNVLKSAAVVYPRRSPDPDLGDGDRAQQARTFVTFTENAVTNPISDPDAHRTPVACESRTFEMTGLVIATGALRFSVEGLLAAGAAAAAIPYETASTPGVLQKRLIEHVRTIYRRDDLAGALPLGRLESRALPLEALKLAFTPGLVAQVYGDRVTTAILATQARYVHSEGDVNWWIPSGQVLYSPTSTDDAARELAYAREHFFSPSRFRDPFGETSTVVYDRYDLLVDETRDALGNRVLARHDYRVLQPRSITDPNGNRSAAAFDALGMVAGTAVMGKAQERAGDTLEGFIADLPENAVAAYLQDPGASAHAVLQRATTRLVYDLFAYQRTRSTAEPQPAVVATLTRETHDADLQTGQTTRVQHALAYSDGFGREIQKKLQAEPGPLADGQPDVTPRWVGTGWTIFNNKGKPVREYEPFFSATHRFEFARTVGVSPVLFHDPLDRVVATLYPNHTYTKVLFDAWRQVTWDVNDTVLQTDPAIDPDVGGFVRRLLPAEYLPTWYTRREGGALGADELAAAQKAAVHAGTPTRAVFDTLGRAFLTVAHNRFVRDGVTLDERYATRVRLDIEGNQREVIDARGRLVMRYAYDMLSNRVRQASMEANERWLLNDVAGQQIYAWTSRQQRIRTLYDALRRPTDVLVSEAGGPEAVVQRTTYGETQSAADTNNLRGQVFQVFDGAGVVTNHAYDFKGNVLRTDRRFAAEYRRTVDWSTPASVRLEPETYAAQTAYDVLNRPLALTMPDGSIVRPAYNEAGLLERIEARIRGGATPTLFVADIDYNAKGQRASIEYGSGVRTTYEYDPHTFRLSRLFTTRGGAFATDCTNPSACGVQNLRYTYDPAGNVTLIRDEAQQTVYFRNRRVEPSTAFTYDAVYRLIDATGREHLGQSGNRTLPPEPTSATDAPRVALPHPGDGNALGRYLQQYVYDEVGNVLQMIHRGTDPTAAGWTRTYAYDDASLLEPAKKSNRLSRTLTGRASDPPVAEPYTHDAHGNMTAMPHLPVMRWDYADRLQATAQQTVGGSGTPETTYYVYNAGGERVRKVTDRAATGQQEPARKNERLYLGGVEIYREFSGGDAVALARETLAVMDDTRRVALVESRTQGSDGSPARLIRYQHDNHLGSASLELDEAAQVISYEEYYPYGSTSYQAVRSRMEAPKCYRYTGKERDEESGLSYHGARYYAPWLGRWTSCDAAGISDGVALYVYVRDNPARLIDPTGRNSFDDLSLFIRNTAGFEQGAIMPPTFQSSSASPFGTAAHRLATRLIQDLQQAPTQMRLFNINRVISEPVIVNGVIVGTGAGPAGAPKGALVPDLLFTNPSTQGPVVGQSASAVAQELGDLKYGGGQAAAKYAQVGVPVRTVNGVSNSATTNPALLQMAPPETPPAAAAAVSESAAAESAASQAAVSEAAAAEASVAAKAGVASKVMKGLGVVGGLAGSATGGYQVGKGLNKMMEGKTAEGAVDVGEGSANLGLTIGVAIAVKAKVVVVETGVVLGGIGAAASVAAAGAVTLAAEETRRALAGEKSAAAEATEYYADLVVEGEKEGGFKGALKQAAGWTGGFFSTLIAVGQGY